MKWFVPSAILWLAGTLAVQAAVVPVDLTFDPPTPTANTVDLDVTAGYQGLERTDSDSATVSGNILANLTVDYDVISREVTDVTGLEFTGGQFVFSDVSFTLDFNFLGRIDADGYAIGGTFDTPIPPGPVAGGSFNTIYHEVIINTGTFEATGTGIIGALLPEDTSIDFSEEPMTIDSYDAVGSIWVSSASIVGPVASYDVMLTMPLDFDERVYDEEGVFVDLAAKGTFVTSGEMTIVDPRLPGDANLDGKVNDADAAILASHWQQSSATWANGDFTYDGKVDDADAAILATHWQEVAEGGPATVPEPGSLGLLIGGLLWLLCGSVARFCISKCR